jgi:hypothetical protein
MDVKRCSFGSVGKRPASDSATQRASARGQCSLIGQDTVASATGSSPRTSGAELRHCSAKSTRGGEDHLIREPAWPVEARSTKPRTFGCLAATGATTSRPSGGAAPPRRERSHRSRNLPPQVQVRTQDTDTLNGKPKGVSGSTAALAQWGLQRTW